MSTIPTLCLKPRELDLGPDEPGIRIGTIRRIKGIEFRAMAMAYSDSSDPMTNLQQAMPFDRCERYVAATRAREVLLVALKRGHE